MNHPHDYNGGVQGTGGNLSLPPSTLATPIANNEQFNQSHFQPSTTTRTLETLVSYNNASAVNSINRELRATVDTYDSRKIVFSDIKEVTSGGRENQFKVSGEIATVSKPAAHSKIHNDEAISNSCVTAINQPQIELPRTRNARRLAIAKKEKSGSTASLSDSDNVVDDGGLERNGNSAESEESLSESAGEECAARKCVVCLRHSKFTEDIHDSQKQVYHHVDVLLAYLNIQIKKTLKNGKLAKQYINSGICSECMNNLQRWHIFNSAIAKRHEAAGESPSEKFLREPPSYDMFEARVYRNYKKMSKVKEVLSSATHAHYARRHLNEKDWDYFCDHLFHSNSVKSEKSVQLEKFLMSREKLSQLYCTKCQKMVQNGKKGYEKHMQTDHNDSLVVYPCDICGRMFPERDMTASTEDYYPHWISHFYFNKCDDCGKRFPTMRSLGQHRHAVHKNRQVKCEKCGKVLANKVSLDLHLLRHLPENEKKKYMVKCKICKKKIPQWNLKSHVAAHSEDRPWKCDHCEANFKTKGALVSHRDVVHFNLKNHVCSICNEAFKSANSLRGHVRRHEGRKDYKCEICLKEYYTYSALKGHKIVHQTTRDFICDTCGKAFKKKKALEEHKTIHTGEKPHQCPICGREIRVKSNLYKHMKIHKKPPGTYNSKRTSSGSPSKRRGKDNIVSHNSSSVVFPSSSNFLTNGSFDAIATVSNDTANILNAIQGNDSMSSSSNLEIISDPGLITDSNVPHMDGTHDQVNAQTSFLGHHFESISVVNSSDQNTPLVPDSIGMTAHQSLLNIPIQDEQYFSAPQYFSALDPMQN